MWISSALNIVVWRSKRLSDQKKKKNNNNIANGQKWKHRIYLFFNNSMQFLTTKKHTILHTSTHTVDIILTWWTRFKWCFNFFRLNHLREIITYTGRRRMGWLSVVDRLIQQFWSPMYGNMGVILRRGWAPNKMYRSNAEVTPPNHQHQL